VDIFKQVCPNFALMRSMVMEFRSIVRHGRTEALDGWLRKARDSGTYSFRRFAKTLRRDLTAVQNALREPFSNGPVEGQINRLKTLKRQMYGRAGFALLRARLLQPATLDSQMVHQT
jgi:transposase